MVRTPFRMTSVALFVAAVTGLASAAPAEAQGYQYFAVTPCRIVDTRVVNPQQPAPRDTTATMLPPLYPPTTQTVWPGPYDPDSPQNFRVRGVSQFDGTGNCGVPTNATAVSVNVTVVSPGSNGDIRIWPYGGAVPLVSTINVVTTDTALANGAIVPMPAYSAGVPDISLRFTVWPKGTGVHVVIDVTGYFQ